MAVLLWFIGPIGRYVSIALVAALSLGGIYEKGRFDERSYLLAKIERQKKDAIESGDQGRLDALRKLDDGKLSNDWFRD